MVISLPIRISRTAVFLLLILLTLSTVPVVKAIAQDNIPSNPMLGRIVFEEKQCMTCHSIGGYGGDIGPDLGREKVFGSFYDLASRLWNHAPQMAVRSEMITKEWPKMTSVELDQLISYLFYLRYLGEPGNVSTGKRLLETKYCLRCHTVGNQGESGGIALDDLQEFASPLYIAQTIWNHGPTMQEEMISMGIERPTFDDMDITHISAYLREFSRSRVTRRQFMSPGNPQTGAKIFVTKGCNSCHATEKNRNSTGPGLSEMNLHRSVTAIAGSMWNHGNTMWDTMQSKGGIQWPSFEGAEMADLIAYLYFYDYLGGDGNAKRGEKVFTSKSCARCHGPGETQAFNESADPGTPTDLVRTMWNHVPYMRELTLTQNIDWPELTADEMNNLYTYLVGWKK